MINAERGKLFRAGKESSPKRKIYPRNLLSGRKRNTFATVAKVFFCVALLNNFAYFAFSLSRLFISRDFLFCKFYLSSFTEEKEYYVKPNQQVEG